MDRHDEKISVPHDGPPAYDEVRDTVNIGSEDTRPVVEGSATVNEDGQINLDLGHVDEGVVAATQAAAQEQAPSVISSSVDNSDIPNAPSLNIVMMIVGSRGDVQPFIPLGHSLKEQGHRVRVATHPNFKDFVEKEGLEFFSIGGDPEASMAFMVKNPGLLPGMESVRKGDFGRQRANLNHVIRKCWRACIDSGNGLDDETDPDAPISAYQLELQRPFVANAIIANPSSFAHIHCAERLSIPLHMVFTMPWSPTKFFPHPLANMKSSTVDQRIANYLSYMMVETVKWQGLGHTINDFREHVLGLNPMNPAWGPGVLERLRIPFTYCFSPSLIPKPADWKSHISVTGFNYLPTPPDYEPPEELERFLENGSPPIYIGFGSIVVDDSSALTSLIFSAIEAAGVRAVVSGGWGGLGSDRSVPKDVFLVDNLPHSWLFERVSAVVHHGGAGTCAMNIARGKPAVIIPFFGDQFFWGQMLSRVGAGPRPIPYRQLTAENLAAAIQFALRPQTAERARNLAMQVKAENGPDEAARVFNKRLPHESLVCGLGTDGVPVWRIKRRGKQLRLSALAMSILARENILTYEDAKLNRLHRYREDPGALEPVTGVTTASLGAISDFTIGFHDLSKSLGVSSPRKAKSGNLSKMKSMSSINAHTTIAASTLEYPMAVELPAEPVHQAAAELESPSHNNTLSPPTRSSTPPSHRVRSGTTSSCSSSIDRTISLYSSPIDTTTPIVTAPPVTVSSPLSQSTTTSTVSPPTTDPSSPTIQVAYESRSTRFKKGLVRLATGTKTTVIDIPLALAQGLHNAPRLYGDTTVRQTYRIDSLGSGVTAPAKELAFGLYDGLSGLVTQPYEGARKEGAVGLVKGFGKGIGGLGFKPLAVIPGAFAYPLKGVQKEVQRWGRAGDDRRIRRALIAMGEEDLYKGVEGGFGGERMRETRDRVVAGWREWELSGSTGRGPGGPTK